ncbi:MAG: hypothetical protein AB7G25_15155 [Sphingomonadaceae bacterium]
MLFNNRAALPPFGASRFGRREVLRFGLWAVAALLALTLVWSWVSASKDQSGSVELTGAAPVDPTAAASSFDPGAAQVSAAPVVAGPPLGQLQVLGVLSSGAIFGFPDGLQRFVVIGRDVVPGARLTSVERLFVTLDQAGSQVRLPLRGEAATGASESPPSAQDESAVSTTSSGTPADRQRQVLNLRLGTDPQMVGDRIVGFRIKPNASLPWLSSAGLQPGDVIVSLNNEPVASMERLMELPTEIEGIRIAKIARPTIQYRRGGKLMNAPLE